MQTTEVKNETRVDGPAGSLHVIDEGEGGIPVVFTHSFSGNALHWHNQLEHLKNTRRLIAFDFRNHGGSERPSGTHFTAEDFAGDIAAVADSLGLEKFVLVGHSMGGAAAIAYAGEHPDRIAGLLLAGAPGKSDPKQSSAIIRSLESDAYQQVMDQYTNQLLENAKPETDSAVRNDMKKTSKETSLAIIKSLFSFDPLPILKNFEKPMLIVSTARENQQPQSLHNQLPDVPNKEIQGTSHWTQLDKPEEFNAALDEFLKTIDEKK